MNRKIIIVPSVFVILLALFYLVPYGVAQEPSIAPIQLRILETTDLHGNILNYDYKKKEYTNEYGLARTASLIKIARKEVPNTLLFDDGDLLQGNELADYAAKHPSGDIHPVFKAMNLLKYDAATFGNHDFHFGFDFLHNSIKGAKFPYVNANIYINDHDDMDFDDINFYEPYVILDKEMVDSFGLKHHLKIGVIGFITPAVMEWEKEGLDGRVKVKDIVATAEYFIPKMKAEGADIIISLVHSGLGPYAKPYTNAEDSVYPLSKVEGIDAILFGHRHQVFPDRSKFKGIPGVNNAVGTINGVAAVEAGSWGNYLGIVDLVIEQEDGEWVVTGSQSRARPIFKMEKKHRKALVESDKDIIEAVKDAHQKTLQDLKKHANKKKKK